MTVEDLAAHTTYWHKSGHGKRQAMLIHCSLAHSGAWRGVEKHLSDDLSMLAFDLPGHGRSGDWDGQGDFQDLSVQIAEALLDKETDGPVDLIGHSFGGTIALRLAQRAPERVRSLTMFEPVLFAAAKDHPEFAKNSAYMEGPFADAMRAGDRIEAARLFNVLWGRDADWQALPTTHQQDMARRIHLIPDGKPVTHDDIHGQAAAGALECLDMPVLLMEGAKSPAIVRATHDAMAARLPNVTRVVLQDAGHMGPITHAGEVAQAIRNHMCEPAAV